MAERTFEADGKQVTLYPGEEKDSPLIVLSGDDGEGAAVLRALREMAAPDCSLLVVGNLNWNHDLSPWHCPPVMGRDAPFTGGAEAYLSLLLTGILPRARGMLPAGPRFVGIAGYSLAGLFALYALYHCDAFDRAASMSGSLWFPGFREYALTHGMKKRPDRLYLSLGDREARAGNALLRTVQDSTEQIVSHYRQLGLDVTWELNPGNHFMDAALRCAKGIRAILAP